jgi:hypothetical protein
MNDYIDNFNPEIGIIDYEGTSEIGIELSIILSLDNSIVPMSGFYPVYFRRKEGDIFSTLIPAIRNYIISFDNIPLTAKRVCLDNFVSYMLIVASKEGVILDTQERVESQRSCFLEPFADVYYHQFQLFKLIKYVGDKLEIYIPHELRDERKAWGKSILRVIKEWGDGLSAKSKKEHYKELRRKGMMLHSRENPFTKKDLELKYLIDYSLTLTTSILDINGDGKDLRKQILSSFDNLRRSYTALSGYLKNNPEIHHTTVSYGTHWLVCKNNHHIKISST